jgi:hypothetical protein
MQTLKRLLFLLVVVTAVTETVTEMPVPEGFDTSRRGVTMASAQ